MSTNTSIQLTNLDFDTLKTSLQTFLSSQSTFKDFDFEGSNMNVLLDVLSYNTYLNTFYLNMVASEMFLDSAQMRDSVVSHAKDLNYVPNSFKSSEANISFNVIGYGTATPFTIPKGSNFSGTNANGTFTFITDQDYSYTSSNSTYSINNLPVYEGKYISDVFIFDPTNEAQRFIISNPNIDTDSLEVIVAENSSNVNFIRYSSLFNLTNETPAYFLQGAENGTYEIVFGDGQFGRLPLYLSVIYLNYRVTNGTDGNGISSFICDQDLGVINGGQATVEQITTISTSAGGANSESMDSIKFYAPRFFATQERAVSSDDYKSLILSQYGNIISDVNVYGGETLEPKQYGRVVLAIQPSVGTIAPDYIKTEISDFLKPNIVLPNRIIITDPDYLYCEVTSKIQYNSSSTLTTPSQLETIIRTNINNFSNTNIESFGADLRYSKLVSCIDNSDQSLVSNDTNLRIIKKITPELNYTTSIVVDFNNPLDSESNNPSIGYNSYSIFADEPLIMSTPFTYVDSSGNIYPLSYLRDDCVGNIVVFTNITGNFQVLNSNIGTINYSTGYLTLNNFKVANYNNNISIYATPLNKDILINNNKILIIDQNDVSITMEAA
jgi:hypothetical protein